MENQTLIQLYLLGKASESETQELDSRLANDADLRREFALAAAIDTGLRDLSMQRAIELSQVETRQGDPEQGIPDDNDADRSARSHTSAKLTSNAARRERQGYIKLLCAVAASVLLAIWFWPRDDQPPVIANLVSSENAAWQSDLPTTDGSDLSAGQLTLFSGIATIRFASGAEVLLEAPAELELVSAMRGRLASGAAIIDVPDSAIGFVVETPDGYAVDYGTRFAVRVDQGDQRSRFEVVEGEIAVHHPDSGDQIRLTGQGAVANIADQTLVRSDVSNSADSNSSAASNTESKRVVRIGTNGRFDTVLRNNKRDKFVDRERLSVKRTKGGKWDHRSFFAFDLSQLDVADVAKARLRLNLVPNVRGFASRLPPINRFGIYGLTNDAKTDWKIGETWETSPAIEDGVLLGTFEVPRSAQRGTFGFANDTLLQFLKSQSSGSATLILVRETTQIEGVGPGLTHAFASDSHPESVGPLLELSFDD